MAQRRGCSIAVMATAAAMIGTFALAGCSTTGQPSSSSNSGGKTTIVYGTTGDSALTDAEQKVINSFEATNPKITVKLQQINFADYDTKMATALRSGQGPDVFRVNHPNVQAWSNAHYLADLAKPIADQKIDTKAFIPGLLAIGKVGSKQYTLPIDTDARAFWYNPKALVKARIVDSSGKAKPPATWDELLTDVAKFKGTSTYGYVYRTDSDYAMAYEAAGPYIKAAGGKILSEGAQPQAVAANDPNTVAALTLLQKIAATKAVPPGEANMSEETSEKLFASGKVAMMAGGPWVRANIEKYNPKLKFDKDYALTVIPTPRAGMESATASGGWQIGINAKSKNAEAAAKFAAFFEQPKNLISLASSNSFPPLINGMNAKPFSTDPFYDAFKKELPNSGLPITPVAQLAQVSAAFESSARAAVNNGEDVKTQLTAFDQKVNEQVLK